MIAMAIIKYREKRDMVSCTPGSTTKISEI